MKGLLRAATLAVMLLAPSAATACPICATETGRRVREGVFGPEFGPNLAATLLPFLVCFAFAAIIYPWTPSPGGGPPPRLEAGPGDDEGVGR